MKTVFSLIFILAFSCVEGWAANVTCYVAPSGSSSNSGLTPAFPKALPSQCLSSVLANAPASNAAGAGHRIYIQTGDYTDNLATTSQNAGGMTIAGVTDLTDPEATPAAYGQVWLRSAAFHVMDLGTPNMTVKSLSLAGTDPSHDLLRVSADNFWGHRLHLYNSGRGLFLAAPGATNVKLSNILGKGAGTTDAAIKFTSGTSGRIDFSVFTNSDSKPLSTGAGSYALLNQSQGAVLVNNSIIIGGDNIAAMQTGSGSMTLNNSILGAGAAGTGIMVGYRTAGTLSFNNCLLIPSWRTIPVDYFAGPVGDRNNFKSASWLPNRRSRSGFIVPCIDDIANITYASDIATVLEQRGMQGTYFVDGYDAVNPVNGYLPPLQALQARNILEIGHHTWTHSDLTIPNGSKIFNLSHGTDTVTIDRSQWLLSTSIDADTLPFKDLPLSEIKKWLEAKGFTVTPTPFYVTGWPNANQIRGSVVTGEAIASATATTTVNLLAVDESAGFFKFEVADAKSKLESLLDVHLTTLATPFGNTSNTLEEATRNSGLLAMRPFYYQTGNTASLSSLNLYRIPALPASYLIGSDDNATRARVRSVCEWAAQTGGLFFLLGHSETEISSVQWAMVLDLIKSEYPEITVTSAREALKSIQSSGLWTDNSGSLCTAAATPYNCCTGAQSGTCTGMNLARNNWGDLSDFRLQHGSPLIGAGDNSVWSGVPNVTDFAGTPVTDASGNVIPRTIGGTTLTNVDVGPLQTTPTPVIGLTPSSLTFGALQGSNPPSQTIAINNKGEGTLSWTATADTTAPSWLSVSPGGGTGSGTLTFSVASATLPQGTYTKAVTVAATGAANTPQTVNVTLIVSPPSLVVPSALAFIAGQGSNPPSQSVTVSNGGGGSLNWTATAGATSPQWLSVSPGSGTDNGAFTVSVDSSSLPLGTYTNTIAIAATEASNSPQIMTVTLTVVPPPSINLSTTSLSFVAAQGTSPTAQAVTVGNGGGAPLYWIASADSTSPAWLSVSPTSGTDNGTLIVSVASGSLAPGVYTKTISVTAAGTSNALQTINVSLTITGSGNLTCYVAPSGSDSNAGLAPDQPKALPSQCLSTVLINTPASSATGGGHRIYILTGDYVDHLATASPSAGGITIAGVTDLSNPEATPAAYGQVWLRSSAFHVMDLGAPNMTVKSLSLAGTDASHDLLRVAADNFRGHRLHLYNSGRGLFLAATGASNVQMSNILGKGAGTTDAAIKFSSGTTGRINYSIFTNSDSKPLSTGGVSYALLNEGEGSVVVNNSIIVGGDNIAAMQTGSGSMTISNSILGAGAAGTGIVVGYRTAGALSFNNCLLIPSWRTIPVDYFAGSVTDRNNLKSAPWLPNRRSRSGFIVPSIDDINNVTYASDIATVLGQRGMQGTYYVQGYDAADPNNGYLPALRALQARNILEIGHHTWTHSDLTIPNGSKIFDLSHGTDTVTIDRSRWLLSTSIDADTLPFRDLPLSDIKKWLEAKGFTVTPTSFYATGWPDASQIRGSVVTGEAISSATTTRTVNLLAADESAGFLKFEIADAKSKLESLLGVSLTTLATPFGNTSNAVEEATRNSGLLAMRPFYYQTGNTASLSSLNLYRIPALPSSYLIGSDDNATRARVRSVCEWAAQTGGIFFLLGHNGTEISPAQWAMISDLIKSEYPEITVTSAGEALKSIQSSGLWTDNSGALCTGMATPYKCCTGAQSGTCTGINLARNNWGDLSDFRLQHGSPLIGAGDNSVWSGVPNVTDFAGTPVTDAAGNVIPRSIGGSTVANVDVGPLQTTPAPILGLTPTSLTFNTTLGSDPPNQTIAVNNNGDGTLSWTAAADLTASAWLSVSPGGGTGSGTLTVSVAGASLPAGTYTGSITVAATGALNTPQTVSVTLNVAPAATIALSSTSLSFTALQGTNPAVQTMTVSNSGAGTLNWSASTDQSWLTVSPASGTNNGSCTVSVTTGSLLPGTYNGTVTVAASGATNTPRTVSVSFTVTASPSIGLTPTSLTFSAAQGTNPATQTVTVANSGAGTLNWSASSDQSWLSVSPTSGTNNGSCTVSVTTGSLLPGTYTGTITVAATGASNTPQTVSVSFTVTATTSPTIGLSPKSLTFSAAQGTNPATQTVTVANSGAGTLNWSASSDQSWLSVSPGSGTNNGSCTVSVTSGSLLPGTYTGAITVAASGASNTPQTISVSFTVTATASPSIGLSPTALSFNAFKGTDPASQTVAISNGGGKTLSWNATTKTSWLRVTPSSGTDSGTLTVSVRVGTMQPGTYTGSITVAASGATNNPRTIPVTLTIVTPPKIVDSPASLSFSTLRGANPAPKTFTISNGGGSTLNWTATTDSTAPAWLSVSPASGTGTGTVTVTVTSSQLASGTYSKLIKVTAPNATNSPLTLKVTLKVNSK